MKSSIRSWFVSTGILILNVSFWSTSKSDKPGNKPSGKVKQDDGQASARKKPKTDKFENLTEEQKLEVLKLLENDTEVIKLFSYLLSHV